MRKAESSWWRRNGTGCKCKCEIKCFLDAERDKGEPAEKQLAVISAMWIFHFCLFTVKDRSLRVEAHYHLTLKMQTYSIHRCRIQWPNKEAIDIKDTKTQHVVKGCHRGISYHLEEVTIKTEWNPEAPSWFLEYFTLLVAVFFLDFVGTLQQLLISGIAGNSLSCCRNKQTNKMGTRL